MKKHLLAVFLSTVQIITSCSALFSQTTKSSKSPIFLSDSASIGGKSSGEISKQAILDSKVVTLDSIASLSYRISEFKLALVSKGRDILEFNKSGDGKLTEEMLQAISDLPLGSKVYIEYIRAIDKSNITHPVRPIALRLK